MSLHHYNKKIIAKTFSASAKHYNQYASVQRKSAMHILKCLNNYMLEPSSLLDLGSGTGFLSQGAKEFYPEANIFSLDIAWGMLEFSQSYHFQNFIPICADADFLPFSSNSFDLILSNLMLQWSSDINATLEEMVRVLKPGGICLFSSLGKKSLYELRLAWEKIDAKPHVHSFPPWSFSKLQPVTEVCEYTEYFDEFFELMQSLRQIGASNIHEDRSRGLLSRRKLNSLIESYENYRTSDGYLPLTYEVYYGSVRK